jgi:hypothetical protein
MNYKNLHTCKLENLFGDISLHIIKQDEIIRIIKLNDSQGVSRTLGAVRFFNVNEDAIKDAHDKIINGGLLGKTLFDFNIDFNKELIGSVSVKLPKWIKNDFKSNEDDGLAFYSRISIKHDQALNEKFLYSELIEVIPLELVHQFTSKAKPLSVIDDNLHFLLKSSNLEPIKSKHKL